MEEFFLQGEQEQKLGFPISPFMDRKTTVFFDSRHSLMQTGNSQVPTCFHSVCPCTIYTSYWQNCRF